jgi:hypothetical protein
MLITGRSQAGYVASNPLALSLQAALMLLNGAAILNEQRFLEKCAWSMAHQSHI